MSFLRPRFAALKLSTRLFTIIAAFGIVACALGATAYMQSQQPKVQQPPPPAERIGKPGVLAPATREGIAETPPLAPIGDLLPTVASNYTNFTTTTGSLTDMTTGTTQLLGANVDDTASPLTNIGFDFYFQGARQTQFSVNENGVLRLGAAAQAGSPYKPLAQAGIPILTAYGADQRTHAGDGKVHFKVTGSAPNRVLNIEWLNIQSTFNTGGTSDLTYQIRLFETTGVIQYVYGKATMSTLGAADANSRDPHIGFSSSNTAGTVGSVTAPQSGTPAPTFNGASATPVANLYTAGVIPVLNSAADGSRRTFTFTPPTPTAPTNLTFTAVAPSSYTLNWTDSADETLYAIYRSTDGTNYTFVNTAAQNATTFAATGLSPNTTYFWQVFAVSEGAFSSALTGSQATAAPGNISSTPVGGNWSATTTWVGGVVPTINDNVTIADAATVTIDSAATANAFSLSVGTGLVAPTTLIYNATVARTLTVVTNVTIASNGIFQSAATGAITTHVLSVSGNLTNNGVLDFSTSGNTAATGITFTGAANNTFGGTGATTDVRTITINKGTSNANILELNPTAFTVQGATSTTTTGNYLTLTNGTFKISGTFTGTHRTYVTTGTATYIAATAGLWLNNPNYTISGQNGSPTVAGLLRISQGIHNVGTASGNSMDGSAGAVFIIEGGTLNTTGRFSPQSAVSYTQSAGTVNVCTTGQTSNSFGCFELFSTSSTFTMSGGTIVLNQASTAATTPIDFDVLSSTVNYTGGTLQIGSAATATNFNFRINGNAPAIIINNTTNNKTATVRAQTVVFGDTTVSPGTTLNLNGFLFAQIGTNLFNNGTILGNTAGSRLYFAGGSPQQYGGSGVAGTNALPLQSLDFDSAGVTLLAGSTNNIITNRVILFTGNVTNSHKITLGVGGTSTGVIQIGNTTTPTNAGSFDVPPIFNFGTGGQVISYLRETNPRTTGNEVNPTRVLTTMSVDNNINGMTLAGGDLAVTGALTLTNGTVTTGSNTLISTSSGTITRTNGYVIGNLRQTYAASGSKTFHVGTANGYSPVVSNVTAGTGDMTVSATQGKLPAISGANALARYWTLTGTGLTANLTFNYLSTDVAGTPANYVFVKNSSGVLTQLAPAAPPTTTSATINGVTSFSDWTLAEPSAIQSGTVQFGSATYSGSESAGTIMINATRTGGTDGTVTVNYATADGTASSVSNADYQSATGTLTWLAGDGSPKSFTVPITSDTDDESDETFTVMLSAPTGGAMLGSPAMATVTILDDDTATLPNVVYVDDDFTGPNGSDPDGAGPATSIGFDAFPTVQGGVNGVAAGGTVNVAAGTYPEQVIIGKSLTLAGAGAATTTIATPATLTPGIGGNLVLVEVNGGATVNASGIAVAGPRVFNGCSAQIFYGVFISGAATLNLSNSTVRDIRLADPSLLGCQDGIAIRAGSQALAQTATLSLNTVSVTNYQKSAVLIDGTGTTATITNSTLTGQGVPANIGANAIQIGRGAGATVTGNTVSGNLCNNAACGPDPFTESFSTGALVFSTSAAVNFSNNTFSNNDVGIYNNATNTTVSGNTFTANRYENLFLDEGNATISDNNMAGPSNVGVLAVSYVGNAGNSSGTLTRNNITGAGVGLQMLDDTSSADNFTPQLTANFNRIVSTTTAIDNPQNQTADFQNNWWGCNAGPGNTGCGAVTGTGADFNPWFVLAATATPDTVVPGGTSSILADMTKNSDGVVPPTTLPDFSAANFSATNGTMTPPSVNVSSNTASSTFTSTNANSAVVTVTVDNQSINVPITVNAPAFSVDDVTHDEGNSGTTSYTFTVTKTGTTNLPSSVNFATVDGTATVANNDYQSNSGTLTFSAADMTMQFTVLVNGDTTVEPDEAFTVQLSSPSGATISDADGTGTITNDDRPPANVVYVDDDFTGAPGTDPDGAGPATEIGYDAFPTIQGGVSNVASGGTVNVAAGTYTENVTVSEPLTLNGAGVSVVTLRPALSSPNCGGNPGGSLCAGSSNLILVQANDVIITGLTLDGDNPTLTSGVVRGGADLDARNGIITNHTAGTFTNLEVHHATIKNIYLRGVYASTGGAFNFHDNTVQNVQGEAASIGLFNFGGAGAFTNNTVSECNDAIASNHSRGTTYTGNTVTTSASGIHSDNAGDIGGSTPDTISGNTVTNSQQFGYGIWTFVPFNTITVSNNTITNVEVGLAAAGGGGGSSTFTGNTVDGQSRANATGVYLTTDQFGFGQGNATVLFRSNTVVGNVDGFFLEANTTDPLTSRNERKLPASVNIRDGRTLDVQAQRKANASLTTYTLNVTADFNRTTGNSATGLTKVGTGTLILNFENNWWGCNAGPNQTGCQTVDAAADFSPWLVLTVAASPNPIAPGGTSTITADLRHNSDGAIPSSTVFVPPTPVAFSATNGTIMPSNATTSNGEATATFTSTSASSGTASATVDNQTTSTNVNVTAPAFSIDDVTMAEGLSGTTAFTFTITKTGTTTFNASVDYATADGTANAPSDYAAVPTTTLTFLPAEMSKQVTVNVNGDPFVETDETFTVNLSNASGATIFDASGTGTITNDDTAPNVVYVDDDFTGAQGTDPDGAGPATAIGHDAFPTVQGGINGVAPGGTVNVLAGTYHEDVIVNKPVTLHGAGMGVTTISGPGGNTNPLTTLQVTASNVVINNFTVTRDGNSAATWNNDLNLTGIAIQGQAITGTVIHDNLLTGNRTGIDINNSNGHTIRNNSITFNRTGMILRNQTDNLTVVENFITNNWTVGVLFLDGSGGSNVPPQSAAHSGFNNNDLSGNWYGEVADRQTGGSIPAPGTSNLKNFRNNWFGTTSPVVTTNNTMEPGYAAQVPVEYGGMATNPGGAPDIAGPASANIKYMPFLLTGTDTNVETTPGRGTNGFQGQPNNVVITPANLQGWVFFDDFPGMGTGSGGFEHGPGTPPLGVGSAFLTVDANGRHAFGTGGFSGTRMDDVTTLAYNSYQNNNTNTTVAISFQFDIDYDLNDANNSFMGRLVFEPYLSPEQGAVQQNVWQNWDALAGKWYGTRTTATKANMTGVPQPCQPEAPCTWQQVIALFPNAGVRHTPGGAVLFKAGGPWAPGFDGNVDNFRIAINAANTTHDFEPLPQLSIDDVTHMEGNSGTTAYDFTVTLSRAFDMPVSFTVATANDTATSPSDYAAVAPTPVTIPAGQTTATVTVQVNGDGVYEANEQFFVNLSNPTNATILDGQGVGTITNDDPPPTFAIDDVTRAEGNSGLTAFTFTIIKSGATELPSSVDFTTADGTAQDDVPPTEDNDYQANSGTRTFAPGEITQAITVLVNGDMAFESNETFTVTLSNPSNATITDGTGLGTITNDDAPGTALVVNTTNDADDGSCQPSHCSLREAINAANSNIDANTITFQIPANDARHFYYADDLVAGQVSLFTVTTTTASDDSTIMNIDPDWPHSWWSIRPTVAGLPNITNPVTIDGYTQTGATTNTSPTTLNTVLRLELNGTAAGAGIDGLRVITRISVIRGFSINRFPSDGIVLKEDVDASNDGDSNAVRGNYIGTDISGTLDLGNGAHGVTTEVDNTAHNSDTNTIGGIVPADRNLISGNTGHGILMTFSSGNIIRGNIIGLAANGSTALGNTGAGVEVTNSTIGGDDDDDGTLDGTIGARNVISANSGNGVQFVATGGSTVQGNYIGTDVSGTLDRGNIGSGISTSGFSKIIGGTEAGAGNLISGNEGHGIFISGGNGNVIFGNLIGTQADGVSALGNGSNGINLTASTIFNTIGGANAGEGNRIAFSGADGIYLEPTAGTNNALRGNSIHSNGGTIAHLGIDLGPDGITPNDPQDPDTGANNLQNFPVLSTAAVTGSTKKITGSLNSTPNQIFTIDFYSNGSCDQPGNGEGHTYLGSTTTDTTDANGNVSFSFNPASLNLGEFVTATATNNLNSTSEFSACLAVIAGTAGEIRFTSATYTVAENVPGGTASITFERIGGADGQITASFSTSDGTANAGQDYTAVTNHAVTFNDGETGMKTVNVPILDDNVREGDETVNLTLSGSTVNIAGRRNAVNLGPFMAVLTITDAEDTPAISINDVFVSEPPTAGTSDAVFTVTLSNPSNSPVTVDYQTADGTANAPADYNAVTTTQITFAPGETSKTITVTVNFDNLTEGNETFSVTLSNPSANATIADGTGTGTITDPVAEGQLLISEFRFRGPTYDVGSVDGSRDEFIELYNNTDAPLTVSTTDGSNGWSVAALSSDGMSAVPLVTIAAGTVIPPRAHYLVANSAQPINPATGGYSLSAYAAPDQLYLPDIADNSGVAVFATATTANYSPGNRLDAAGFSGTTGATAEMFREGAGLTSPGANDGEYAFVRKLVSGFPQDTDINADDFTFVSTDGNPYGGVQSQLGAPGPENKPTSPVQRNGVVKASLIDGMVSSAASPNRVRSGQIQPGVPNAFGTLSIQRRFKNTLTVPITRLRFRVVDITTLNTPAASSPQADLRVLSSTGVVTNSQGDEVVEVEGLTLEAPPSQPNGGGMNSSLTVIPPGGMLAPGATIDVQFLLGVQEPGNFRFLVNVEALPGPSDIPPPEQPNLKRGGTKTNGIGKQK